MGAVDQAVGEVLNYYLEEHPKEAKAIVDKVILAATARHAARKAREMVQRKSPCQEAGYRENWLTVRIKTRKSANCSSSRRFSRRYSQTRP